MVQRKCGHFLIESVVSMRSAERIKVGATQGAVLSHLMELNFMLFVRECLCSPSLTRPQPRSLFSSLMILVIHHPRVGVCTLRSLRLARYLSVSSRLTQEVL